MCDNDAAADNEDGEAAAGMLVRVLGLKTDCTQNKEEPIYLDQEDCRSCTKQTQFKDLDTTCWRLIILDIDLYI